MVIAQGLTAPVRANEEKRHNLHAYLGLMVQARHYLEAGDYRAWHRGWVDRYESGMASRRVAR